MMQRGGVAAAEAVACPAFLRLWEEVSILVSIGKKSRAYHCFNNRPLIVVGTTGLEPTGNIFTQLPIGL